MGGLMQGDPGGQAETAAFEEGLIELGWKLGGNIGHQVSGGIMGGRRMNRPTQLRTNAHPCVIMRYNANLALAHQRKEV
jgi:hypothetical protein